MNLIKILKPTPPQEHSWGNWQTSRIPVWKIGVGSTCALFILGASALYFRAEFRKAELERVLATPKSVETSSADLSGPQLLLSSKNDSSPTATPESIIPLDIQADLDAVLAVATNLIRNPRETRPVDNPDFLPSLDTPDSENSDSAQRNEFRNTSLTTRPLEAIPESKYHAAAASHSDLGRHGGSSAIIPESIDAEALARKEISSTAIRVGRHQLIPIQAISSASRPVNKSESSTAISFNNPQLMSRDDALKDLPALPPRTTGHAAGSFSGLIRAIPIPENELVLLPDSMGLSPNLGRKPTLIPFTQSRLTNIPKSMRGKPAMVSTVNIKSGGTVERFSVHTPLEPGPSGQGAHKEITPYQSSTVVCTPWIVQPGQSLESLAAALSILPGEILDINHIASVVTGQKIHLPIQDHLTQSRY